MAPLRFITAVAVTLALASTVLAGEAATVGALPAPSTAKGSLDDVLARRRSVRRFAPRSLTRGELGQLCWAAQGLLDARTGRRTAPSAGATYPLELYLVSAEGVFRYVPSSHRLEHVADGDRRGDLARAALGQDSVRSAPVSFVVTGVVARTMSRYAERAERYVWIEAGHAAQNLLLEATSLDLGAVPVGAFDDGAVQRVVGAARGESAIYVIPIGHPAE